MKKSQCHQQARFDVEAPTITMLRWARRGVTYPLGPDALGLEYWRAMRSFFILPLEKTAVVTSTEGSLFTPADVLAQVGTSSDTEYPNTLVVFSA